jgi:hypothetical protein
LPPLQPPELEELTDPLPLQQLADAKVEKTFFTVALPHFSHTPATSSPHFPAL